MDEQMAQQTQTTREVADVTTRMTELATDTYTTWMNSLVWWQERSLETTKTLMAQAERVRGESRRFVEDYNTAFVRGQQLWQEAWQDGAKSYMSGMDYARSTSDAAVADLNRRIDQLQNTLNTAANRA